MFLKQAHAPEMGVRAGYGIGAMQELYVRDGVLHAYSLPSGHCSPLGKMSPWLESEDGRIRVRYDEECPGGATSISPLYKTF